MSFRLAVEDLGAWRRGWTWPSRPAPCSSAARAPAPECARPRARAARCHASGLRYRRRVRSFSAARSWSGLLSRPADRRGGPLLQVVSRLDQTPDRTGRSGDSGEKSGRPGTGYVAVTLGRQVPCSVGEPVGGESAMARSLARPFVLPREFPEGTRFVVEGRPDPDGKTRIVSRYLVFPDGRRVDLPAPASAGSAAAAVAAPAEGTPPCPQPENSARQGLSAALGHWPSGIAGRS